MDMRYVEPVTEHLHTSCALYIVYYVKCGEYVGLLSVVQLFAMHLLCSVLK